ncbi:hypothetical protein M231_04095 [Tremella mesenterica]|uniref:Zn(2)-C6 fungal-type domain-containing protein n=1 Tax=Tremella mesenterica TaxID=5217 RepID=A0A4Q1BLB8_TREME|nr:hypothetical protein M231_04095 [Tremella mesenterica]
MSIVPMTVIEDRQDDKMDKHLPSHKLSLSSSSPRLPPLNDNGKLSPFDTVNTSFPSVEKKEESSLQSSRTSSPSTGIELHQSLKRRSPSPPRPSSLRILLRRDSDKSSSPKLPRLILPPIDGRSMRRRSASPVRLVTPWQSQSRLPTLPSPQPGPIPATATLSPPGTAGSSSTIRSIGVAPLHGSDFGRRLSGPGQPATPSSETNSLNTLLLPRKPPETAIPAPSSAPVASLTWPPTGMISGVTNATDRASTSMKNYPSPEAWFALASTSRDRHRWSREMLQGYHLGVEDTIRAMENGIVGVNGRQFPRPVHIKHDIPRHTMDEYPRRIHPPPRPSPRTLYQTPISTSPGTPTHPSGLPRSFPVDLGQHNHPAHPKHSLPHQPVYSPYGSHHPTSQSKQSPSPTHSPQTSLRPHPHPHPHPHPQHHLQHPHMQHQHLQHFRHSYPSVPGPSSRTTSLSNSMAAMRTHDNYLPLLFQRQTSPGMMGSPNNPERRTRQPISCYGCRQRKLKCDGIKPCCQCVRRGNDKECDYAPMVRRRGKGKKHDRSENSSQSADDTPKRDHFHTSRSPSVLETNPNPMEDSSHRSRSYGRSESLPKRSKGGEVEVMKRVDSNENEHDGQVSQDETNGFEDERLTQQEEDVQLRTITLSPEQDIRPVLHSPLSVKAEISSPMTERHPSPSPNPTIEEEVVPADFRECK